MKRRNSLEIKKQILNLLKKEEMSLRKLETKVNTNHNTVKNHIRELEFFGFVTVIHYEKNKKNGRPYTTIRLK